MLDFATECETSLPIDSGVLGCWVLETNLMSSPFFLTYSSIVIARVSAANEIGSITSEEGGTAILSPPPPSPPPDTTPPTPPNTPPTTPPEVTSSTPATPSPPPETPPSPPTDTASTP
jgi:hypothetical protein